jgi:glycosyltransferase involved in cell wall biosynthesis
VPRLAGDVSEVQFLPHDVWLRPGSLLKIARDANARLVHSHFTWLDVESLYAGRRIGVPVIWQVDNGLLDYPLAHRLQDLVKARLLGRACDAVVAVSDHVANDLRRRGFPSRKLVVLQNALDLEQFRDPVVHRDESRRHLGVAEDAFVVVSFCWPPFTKGADVLLRAVARLADEVRDRPLAVVAVGEKPQLEQFVRERNGTMPRWLSIVPPVEDVTDVFGAADAFVSASRVEGFSYAVAEAMACGLPIVGSDIPGTSHFWPAPCFLSYPVEDADALAACLRAVIAHGGREQGAANRRWAFEHLQLGRLVDETIELYERLLARRPA